MIAYLKDNFKIWWLGSFYIFLSSGLFTTLYIYFIRRHVSFQQILYVEFLSVFIITLAILIKHKWHTQYSLYFSFVCAAVAVFSLFLPLPTIYLLPIYGVISHLGTVFFYVIFTILFFSSGKEDKNLQHTTFYWAIMIISGIIGPLIGGFILAKLSIFYFALVAFVILGILFYLIRYVPVKVFTLTTHDLFNSIRGFRKINLLDGALHKVGLMTITLMSLRFIDDEFDFGKYLSLVSMVALIFSFRTAKISDRINRRMIFIWPLSIGAAVTTTALYFVNDFYLYVILALLLKALTVMVEPMRTNILKDRADKNNPIIWISREFYLNTGRTIFWLMTAILWYFGQQSILFIIMGLLYLLFPIIVEYKKIYATAN